MQLVISLLFFALWGWGNAFCASHSHKVGSAPHSGLMRPAKRGIMSADHQKGSAARGGFVSVQCASNPDLSRLSPLELKLRKFGLPDKLTYSRVLMIPAFMMTFILGMKEWAIGLYVASCITDFLDGYLARRWKQTTAFGAFLDPVADKLMVTVALVFLCCQLPTWWFATPVALILMRELGVSALREWMAARGKRATVQVGGLGKWKTALQMISTSLLMYACPSIAEFDLSLSQGMDKPVMFTVGLFTMYLSTILTVVSGMQYLKAAWPELTSKSTN